MSFVIGAPVGLVIVFTGKIDDVERQFLRPGAIDAKVIPVGLAVAAVLILFPLGARRKWVSETFSMRPRLPPSKFVLTVTAARVGTARSRSTRMGRC